MVILHFDLQPQFKYMNYFISTLHHFTPHGRYELNKLASLPMCGFIAQLVEHRTGIAEVTGSNPVEALIFSGFFFQLLKLENLLRWSFFTLILLFLFLFLFIFFIFSYIFQNFSMARCAAFERSKFDQILKITSI